MKCDSLVYIALGGRGTRDPRRNRVVCGGHGVSTVVGCIAAGDRQRSGLRIVHYMICDWLECAPRR
jgi:hypothetical protein